MKCHASSDQRKNNIYLQGSEHIEQGYLLVIVSLILTGCTIKQEYSDHLIQKGETHFKDLRQLTYSGENAEAYFSADGKKLIFQSHDGDSLCDQIYIMDILSGSTELVFTGAGVTTCSFSNTRSMIS